MVCTKLTNLAGVLLDWLLFFLWLLRLWVLVFLEYMDMDAFTPDQRIEGRWQWAFVVAFFGVAQRVPLVAGGLTANDR